MSRYRESILTDKGLDLARKAANGIIKITFTKGVLSADAHQNDNIQTVEGLTTLNAFVQSDPINYVTPSDDANVNVPLRFHNTNMTTDGYINTVGLYATDGTTEVLYSIIINDDPELFAAYNGTTPESVKINHTTQVGRADQVNVQVSPLGMVTEEEFQSSMAAKVTFSGGAITTGNGTFVPLSTSDAPSTIKTAISNGDNFDNYLRNGTYPINDVTIRTIGGSGGLPSLEHFTGDLTVIVKGNEIIQLISGNNNVQFFRVQGQFWGQVASQKDIEALQSSAASNASNIANVNTALSSAVTYSGGYITTGNGSFVPAAINDVTSSIAFASNVASSAVSSASQQEANDIGSVNTALSSKVSFSGGTITTSYGTFVPAATNDITTTVKNTISNGDNFDNYLHNGTYPINNVDIRTIGGSGGLPSLTGFTGDLTVIVKGNEIIQLISSNTNLQYFRVQGQFWAQLASQSDVINLQNQINANNSNISAIQTSVGNNASSINALSNDSLQYRGEWTEQGLWNVSSQPDGWYYVRTNHQDGITGWNNLNSQLFKTSMPSGCMLRLYDSWGHYWFTNNFNGSFFTWKQVI